MSEACKGKNCGSTDPRFHSAECFEEYERSSGIAAMKEQSSADQRAEKNDVEKMIRLLYRAFTWRDSPEGYEYWKTVGENLAKKVGKTLDDY